MIYEYVPHTADLALKVEGYTLKELFVNSLKGMNNILKSGFCDEVKRFDSQMTIEVSSESKTELLINFLSDVLALTNIQKSIFCGIYFSYFSETRVVAQLFGTWFCCFDEDIKGITYHEAHVSRNKNGKFETCIIFDV
ncbi:archease [Flagellimonas meridianipacifica]|uniref:SHS2 domain-containing protein n=1 Tax=Flagellimonas meridianipacifica TaxID=1080225 RepID=A0A2T0MB47_9FLAO|nr:archease [Allomuricauda pacifica]PRX54642.1 SHS2 domain-containing protein [Allomuricauda pacifica]